MSRSAQTPAPVVLLVEDEAGIRQFVRTALESEGCLVAEATTLERGQIETASRRPDLLILDLGLPDGDGMSLLQSLRRWSHMPVLVLSARADETDKVAALDAGADDYLSKPFGVAELLARVRALLRRVLRPPEGASVVRFGDVEIDLGARLVSRAGTPVHLTPIEFRLLSLLVRGAGRVLTQRELLVGVWGPNHVEHGHYLRVYMAGLRRKLERDPALPAHILTESGVGYRLQI
ncbi:two-component system response regulator KdpE [Thauera sp.]|uniref:two-component system response regulator KdpE n=1 Tax=Thauera sp. TaxID=1905334 RepID=UPI00257E56A6|nr:two-component system response regulator KdpE [Thauera sp.]